MKKIYIIIAILILSGCSTLNRDVSNDISVHADEARSRFLYGNQSPLQTRVLKSRVFETSGRFMPAMAVAGGRSGEWLRKFHVDKFEATNPVPLSAVQKWLTEQGINVMSDLPLDSVTFSGKINPTDAETALKMIVGSVGLDFQVDDVRRVVTIRPMASKTWTINIGNRRANYTSNTDNQNTNSSSGVGTGNDSGLGNSVTMSGMQSPMNGSGVLGGTTNSSNSGSTNGVNGDSTSLVAADNFWGSLAIELDRRLKIRIPKNMLGSRFSSSNQDPASTGGVVPGIGVPMVQTGSTGDDLYVEKTVGNYALNPDTGAITVTAPNWVLHDLDEYFKGAQEMYNTDITFVAEIALVTSTKQESEGIDITGIAKWAASKYGAVVSNNALGGITISGTNGIPSVSAGAQSVPGALLGLTYDGANNAFNIFNAYLAQKGNVDIIQKPMITTTSGVPGVFEKKMVDYYNTVSQQTSAGSVGSATTATQNILTPYETGTEMRVNPRIDITTGLVRSPLFLSMVIKTGEKNVPQAVSSNNAVQTVNQIVPLLTRHKSIGEVLLRDGDLIVVGGQVEDQGTVNNNGLPNGGNDPIGGIFGVKKAEKLVQTYYFALRVVVTKRQ